jgi:hypothetical protein
LETTALSDFLVGGALDVDGLDMAESRGYRPTLRPDANRNPDDHVTGGLSMVASISLNGSDDFSKDSGHLTRSSRSMQARHPTFYFEDGNCIFLVRNITNIGTY